MKRHLAIGLLLFFSTVSLAQVPQSGLDTILSIKRNPDHIADWCTLASREGAIATAERGVRAEIDTYLKENNFKHIHSSQDIPPEMLNTFTCYMQEAERYRAVSYVSKKALADMEQAIGFRFENHGKAAIEELLEKLVQVRTLEGVKSLLAREGVDEFILWGDLTFNTPLEYQPYLDNGYFVFFNNVSGAVVDILTPQKPVTRIRKSLWTGKETDPLQYDEEVLWIFINTPAE